MSDDGSTDEILNKYEQQDKCYKNRIQRCCKHPSDDGKLLSDLYVNEEI